MRSRRKNLLTIWLVLAALLLAAACGKETTEEADRGENDPLTEEGLESVVSALTEKEFTALGASDDAEIDGYLGKGEFPGIAPQMVKVLAEDQLLIDVPGLDSGEPGGELEPMLLKLLPDLHGKPSAYVAVYSLDGSTVQDMFKNLKEGFIARENGLKESNAEMIFEGEATMKQLGSFHTVVMGATPFSKRFIQARAGAPRFLSLGMIAHKRVARQLKLPPKAIKIVGARYDNRAGPGQGFSIVLEAGEDKEKYLYQVVPGGVGAGFVMPLAEAIQHSKQYYQERPLNKVVKDGLAAKWNKSAQAKGFADGDEDWCVGCASLEAVFAIPEEDTPPAAINKGKLADILENLDPDGVESCDNCSDYVRDCWSHENLNQYPFDGDFPAPEGECTGFTYEFASTAFISGVPNFDQWPDDFYTAFLDDGNAAVGCGPVAAATVLAWHDSLGFTNLVTEHENGGGFSANNSATYTGWRGTAVRLNVLMNTTEIGSQAYTLPGNFEDGLEEYIENRGYSYSFAEVDETTDFISQIVNGRPLLMLYSSYLPTWDHYAVIQGYYNDPDDDDFYVHVNMGAGGQSGTLQDLNNLQMTDGIVRYNWDALLENRQDPKVWRLRINSGDEWDSSGADCGAFTPCSDLGLTGCADYAAMPPYRSSDPVTVRPPNIYGEGCSTERDLFDATDCGVKFWGNCLSASETTFTCNETDPDNGADYLQSCL